MFKYLYMSLGGTFMGRESNSITYLFVGPVGQRVVAEIQDFRTFRQVIERNLFA